MRYFAARTARCSESLEAGALRLDSAARSVTYEGKPVALGATEFRLLEFLARNAGMALSRAHIVERIWDYDFDGSSNIVDVYVSQLRRKLELVRAESSRRYGESVTA